MGRLYFSTPQNPELPDLANRLSKRSPEHFACRCTVQRFFECSPRETEGSRRNRRPKDVKGAHGNFEALPSETYHIPFEHATFVEAQAREWMWSDYVEPFGDLQSGIVASNNERADAARARRFIRSGTDNVKICDTPV
jgi:hypothetical protein